MYQCIYCKAQYEHSKSYTHNAYECLKRKGHKGLAVVLVICLLSLTGCEAIKGLLPKDEYPANVDRAELNLYVGGKVYKYTCAVNAETKSLTDCVEVQ